MLSPDLQACPFCAGGAGVTARVVPDLPGGSTPESLAVTAAALPHPPGWTGNVQMISEAG